MWAVFDGNVPSSWSVGGRVVDFFDIACVPACARVRVRMREIIRSLSLSAPIDFRQLIGVREKTKGRRTIDNASLEVCPYTLFLQSEVGLLRFYLLQQTVALIFRKLARSCFRGRNSGIFT